MLENAAVGRLEPVDAHRSDTEVDQDVARNPVVLTARVHHDGCWDLGLAFYPSIASVG